MKYEIHLSINGRELIATETSMNDSLFIGKLQFFTDAGYVIHKIKKIE